MPAIVQKWLPLLLVTSAIILIDQIAKNWIIANMYIGDSQPLLLVLYPYLQVTHIANTGVAFGLGSGGSDIFLILSLLIVGGILVFYARAPKQALLQQIALAFVVGGALGNAIDRIQHGYVVDFVHITIPGLISNVSNFADHAIVIGVGLLLLESYLQDRQQKQVAEISAS